jgi:hypothetical protein
MGSLITALQNQNIAAANQETLGDIYAANPQNLGYTENPFEYTSTPAVIQTAYPQYGYNATAPMMPPSYEEYDLTTLFGMLQNMQSSAGTQGDAGPMMPLPNMPSPYLEPMVPHMPSPDLGPMVKPMVPNMPSPYLEPMVPSMPSPGPVTPAGILAQLAGEVQKQTGQPTPVPGAYTVPGTEPVTPEPEEEEEEVVVAPAAPAMSQAEMVARNIAGPELRRRAEAASNRALPRNISADEAFLMMNYE